MAFHVEIVFLPYYKKTSFNHKNLTPNQKSDIWVQNEYIVDNLHLRV